VKNPNDLQRTSMRNRRQGTAWICYLVNSAHISSYTSDRNQPQAKRFLVSSGAAVRHTIFRNRRWLNSWHKQPQQKLACRTRRLVLENGSKQNQSCYAGQMIRFNGRVELVAQASESKALKTTVQRKSTRVFVPCIFASELLCGSTTIREDGHVEVKKTLKEKRFNVTQKNNRFMI
jgi:hypothetical protein